MSLREVIGRMFPKRIPTVIGVILALTAGALYFCVARVHKRRTDAAEAKALAYSQALADIKLRAERLRETASQDTQIQEAVNEERQALADTPDSDLVSRANALFGVSDSSGKR